VDSQIRRRRRCCSRRIRRGVRRNPAGPADHARPARCTERSNQASAEQRPAYIGQVVSSVQGPQELGGLTGRIVAGGARAGDREPACIAASVPVARAVHRAVCVFLSGDAQCGHVQDRNVLRGFCTVAAVELLGNYCAASIQCTCERNRRGLRRQRRRPDARPLSAGVRDHASRAGDARDDAVDGDSPTRGGGGLVYLRARTDAEFLFAEPPKTLAIEATNKHEWRHE